MSPLSRLLPEVSGFTISFIGGSGGPKGLELEWVASHHQLLQVEWGCFNPMEWNQMEWNVLCCQSWGGKKNPAQCPLPLP